MNEDETYNGWTNRETWAFNLHWQNDQGLYNEMLERAAEHIANTDDVSDSHLGEAMAFYFKDQLIDSWEEDTGERLPESLRLMRDEVGSWWRIDYAEVGAAVRESLGNESGE